SPCDAATGFRSVSTRGKVAMAREQAIVDLPTGPVPG
ncbi:MAG: hypothetical protein ACI8R4_003456, partial [Paracoccaceae bacterium]